ncbi:hypothetical protein [Streptomyces wuyuanensis]|uniref:hypothetical protein n=1 Tax=Streptomyces wuyuanensis TaxID=1196353 RepID=UPI0037125FCE
MTDFTLGDKIPWVARLYLHHALKRERTGILFDADIREPPRSMSPKWSTVWIKEGKETLCAASKVQRFPKFVDLDPGEHKLEFIVTRKGRGGTSFTKEIEFQCGQIVVVLCEPIQPNVFYRKSSEVDSWRIGIVPN